MGLTDVLKLHFEERLSATYYPRMPENPRDNSESFHYDIVNESDRQYAKLLNNIQTEATVMTIKTDDKIDFKTTGYIATQDGLFWQIQGVIKNLKHENTKEALRFLKETVQTSYIIRLVEVDNPWELK